MDSGRGIYGFLKDYFGADALVLGIIFAFVLLVTSWAASVQVSFKSGEAVIHYNPEKCNLDDVCERIRSLGPFMARQKTETYSTVVVHVEGKAQFYIDVFFCFNIDM